MKTKLIDLLGLTNMANDIRDWVNAHFQRKVDGKGLSTYDYDKTAKDKVDAIPADPKYTDTTYEAGDGISIENNVISATGGGEENVIESISVNGTEQTVTNKNVDIAVPTKTSDLQNDSGFITGFTETDPTVPSWAKQQNKPSYNYSEIGNTPDLSGFITKSVNDLTNYYLKSETYTKDEVAALIGAIQQFHYEIYATLPASGESNVLYLIGPTGSGSDRYEEYVYANNAFTKIGDTSIDLSGYVTTSALNTALNDYVLSSSITDVLRYSSQSLTDAQKSQARTNIGATAPEVFVATYGTTTRQEVMDAINSGKIAAVRTNSNKEIYICSYVNTTTGNTENIYFFCGYQGSLKTVAINSGGTWSGPFGYTAENSSNKVTSFQSTPDDTHYPSEKLVKDSLDTKIDNTDVEALTAIDVDNTPMANSSNLVTSGGVYTAINGKEDVSNKVQSLTGNETNENKYPSTKALFDAIGKWGVVSQTITYSGSSTNPRTYTISNQVYGFIPKVDLDTFIMCGATFNDTGSDITVTDWFGREFTHKNGCFCLNGLGDLSYKEVKYAYEFAHIRQPYSTVRAITSPGLLEASVARTNFWTFSSNWNTTHSLCSVGMYTDSGLTTIRLRSANSDVWAGALRAFLNSAKGVRYVYPVIECSNITQTGSQENSFYMAFYNCYSLEEIRLKSVKVSVSFNTSSILSLASVLYIVENAANTSAITITLHATAYARCQADTTEYTYNSQTYTGILAYASAKNITIASA